MERSFSQLPSTAYEEMLKKGFHRDDETSFGFRSSGSLCFAIYCGTGRQSSIKERPK